MRTPRWMVAGLLCVGICCVCACQEKEDPKAPPRARRGAWSASQTAVVENMDVPESVVVDGETGVAYVSNIVAAEGKYWTDDGKAFLSRLKPPGKLDKLRWREGTDALPLHAPKGMCLMKGSLYVADNTRVVRYVLGTKIAAVVDGVRGQQLNDLASDGHAAYVSDTGAGKVYRIAERKAVEVKAPPGVNGITFFRGKMFAVSWALHEVYELDPAGKAAPKPFGLAKHFTALDGIEVLDDGTFVVSDFEGHKVCTISPDRKTVRTLCQVKTPADIGLDRKRSLLYVPQFMHKKVVVYKLQKK